jgi:hypothetical protein
VAAQVIQAFVRQAMSYIDSLPTQDAQTSLIKTLQTVTEGKVGCRCVWAAGVGWGGGVLAAHVQAHERHARIWTLPAGAV